jgi:hypothetical protein
LWLAVALLVQLIQFLLLLVVAVAVLPLITQMEAAARVVF